MGVQLGGVGEWSGAHGRRVSNEGAYTEVEVVRVGVAVDIVLRREQIGFSNSTAYYG